MNLEKKKRGDRNYKVNKIISKTQNKNHNCNLRIRIIIIKIATFKNKIHNVMVG